ncbi:FkbM family methyltransferase [Ochrobactrum sp. Sa2BUA5]|nr:FkbM family methyltransferase [Ochrobactrum gallinarum]
MTVLRVHGVKVGIAQQEVSDVIWQALHQGSYEAKEAKWVFKAIRRNDRVLELGAGLGIVSSLIASITGVRLWAFEANPHTCRLARRVIDENHHTNIVLNQGILSAGDAQTFDFYVREDLWMSSTDINQGPFNTVLQIVSADIDDFIVTHKINVLVMDIEGAERDLLENAQLAGVERIFLEFHDHLYGLDGIRAITLALAAKGFAYDPRGSCGACVLFAKDDSPRAYEDEDFDDPTQL